VRGAPTSLGAAAVVSHSRHSRSSGTHAQLPASAVAPAAAAAAGTTAAAATAAAAAAGTAPAPAATVAAAMLETVAAAVAAAAAAAAAAAVVGARVRSVGLPSGEAATAGVGHGCSRAPIDEMAPSHAPHSLAAAASPSRIAPA
jgi:hypothetical protein